MFSACKTPGCIYHTLISTRNISVTVDFPFDLKINEEDAILLEQKLHTTIETAIEQAYNTNKDKTK